jgi:TolB-like protein/Tfp pilus assembly protein PilF
VPTEQSSDVKFEIGHVLFIDIVAYSKLLITEQSNLLDKLKEIVRGTEQFRIAKAEGKLLAVPSGDGGALVFRNSPEAAALCAMEISEHLKNNPELRVRMGIHSGPVNEVTDVSGHRNVAGAGINMAQRVMDCGDAGHILLSKHVAEDLEQYPRWRPYLHQLGECEVKHGLKIGIVNLVADGVGNAEPPQKFEAVRKHRTRVRWAEVAVAVLALGAIIAAFVLLLRRPSPESAVADKSIAVLPFENLSSEKENAYFSDGVQDEILTDLAKIADLKVISRSSVLQYKSGAPRNLREIGQQLGVAHLLEGNVQRAANKIRVNAQLVDARNNSHVWAQSYDRDLNDVFAIQTEIAKTIADQLQAKLSPHEQAAIEQRPTGDLAAFELYSRAKTLILSTPFGMWPRNALLEANDLLNSATTRDPLFYDAWCQLVYANDYLYTGTGDHTPARLAAADAALRTVMRLRPDAPETHLARGSHLYFGVRDYSGALAELNRASEALPNDSRVFQIKGLVLRRQGKQEEGLRALQQAAALDPRNLYSLTQLNISYQLLRRYTGQIQTWDRILKITPDDAAAASQRALVELMWHADTRPLHQLFEQLRLERPQSLSEVADNWFICALAEHDWPAAEQALTALTSNPFWWDGPLTLSNHFAEGLLARALHDEQRARRAFGAARVQAEEIVREQQDFGPALCQLGLIDAALGNKDVALQEGHRAMALLPVDKDPIDGQMVIAYFAIIAAWAGETDLAVQQLATVAPTPGANFIASYGVLKLLPFWDPLRGDPRFEQIVQSLAPKDAASPTK